MRDCIIDEYQQIWDPQVTAYSCCEINIIFIILLWKELRECVDSRVCVWAPRVSLGFRRRSY